MKNRAIKMLKEARFTHIKTLEGFDFCRSSYLFKAQLKQLAVENYIQQAE